MLVNACISGNIFLSSAQQNDVRGGSSLDECRGAWNLLIRSFGICTRVQPRTIKLASFSRPNVVKLTLINKIVRSGRVLCQFDSDQQDCSQRSRFTGPDYMMKH